MRVGRRGPEKMAISAFAHLQEHMSDSSDKHRRRGSALARRWLQRGGGEWDAGGAHAELNLPNSASPRPVPPIPSPPPPADRYM